MRKKIIGIILLTLGLIVFPIKTNAELSCDRSLEYIVTNIGQQCVPLNGTTYRMKLYTATLNGSPIKTYCIEPVLREGSGVNRCLRRIDPTSNANGETTQAYDIAVTKAYQILTKDGRNTTSTADRILGEIIFRWIGSNYGLMANEEHQNAVGIKGCGYPLSAEQLVDIFSNPFLSAYWNTGNSDFEYAKSVFSEAVAAGDMIKGSTYEQVAEAADIWGDEYNFDTTYETRDGITYATVNITLVNDVQTVYWSQFKGGCSNNTVKCATMEASGSGNSGKVVIQISEAANYNGQPYGIYIDSSIYDIRSSSANMIIVQGSARNQKMLLVADSSSNMSGFPSGGGRHHTDDEKHKNYCICDESTGYYVYTDEKGNKTQWPEGSSRPINVPSDISCPGTCTKTTEDKHICEIVDGQHYCEDGETCDEDEYIKDCLCNPVVTVPSSCVDLEGNGITSNDQNDLTGYISDIATTGKNCNNSNVINQIKKCVIDNKDATGESFEATTEMSNNPYCKVWCSEAYDFNLPTAKYSTSGGYFTLSTTIKAQRDCYVSSADDPTKPIDEAKFNQDLEKAQHDVIDAWNDFSYWAAAMDAEVHIEEKQTNKGTCYNTARDPVTGETILQESEGVGPRSYTYVWAEWEAIQYNYDGSIKDKNEKGEYKDGSGSCGCETCSKENGVVPKELIVEIDPDDLNIDTDDDNKCDLNCDTNNDGKPDLNIDADGDKICDYKCDTDDDGTCDFGCDFSDKWNKEYAAAESELVKAINNLNTIISQYNSCTGVITNSSNTDIADVKDASSTADSSWDNDMEFNPTIKFTYNEDYINSMTGEFEKVSDNPVEPEYMYCSGDTDDEYNCQSGRTKSIVTTSKRVFTCDRGSCSWKNFNVSTAKWIKKTKIHDENYQVKDRFSTYTQYGTIKVQEGADNDYLWTTLPEGALPVAMIQKTGVFPFKFTFGNIGQSNSTSSSLGRLIGNEVSVLTSYNKLDEKYKCNGNAYATTDGGYVCHYLNNCPGCDFICDDDNSCEFEECADGYCVMTCTDENGCYFIFDGENTTYNFRTVSLNNLFPNDRDIGYNWSKTSKAEATLNEISKGLDDSNPESIYETPQYSFTLTPTNLKNIREYNDEAGSFTNTTMPEAVNNEVAATVCEKVTIGGITYPVKCQSTFLDLIEISGNKYATNVIRPDPDDNNNWTLFSDTEYCPNGDCLGNGIGPAWK